MENYTTTEKIEHIRSLVASAETEEKTLTKLITVLDTDEAIMRFAQIQCKKQIGYFASHMLEPKDGAPFDAYKIATSSSFEVVWTMLMDLYSLFRKDNAYYGLLNNTEYVFRDYEAHKKIVDNLTARLVAVKNHNDKVKLYQEMLKRQKNGAAFTEEEEKLFKKLKKEAQKSPKGLSKEERAVLTASRKYVKEYEDIDRRIIKNRLTRSDEYDHKNTAEDILQESYYIVSQYRGYKTTDIAEILTRKNGNTKEIDVFKKIRNYIQKQVRDENKSRTRNKSLEQISLYTATADDYGNTNIDVKLIYIDPLFGIEDGETYRDIFGMIEKCKFSEGEQKAVKLRLKGYTYEQIADTFTESKLEKLVKSYFADTLCVTLSEAMKQLETLLKNYSIYEIFNTINEKRERDGLKPLERPSTSKGNIVTLLDRASEKYIKVFGVEQYTQIKRKLNGKEGKTAEKLLSLLEMIVANSVNE